MNVAWVRRPGAGRRGPAHPVRPLALTIAAAAVLYGCVNESQPSRHVVEITDFTFQPDTLRVAVGDTVVWMNRDVVPHTASASEGAWDSGPLDPNATWTYVTEAEGEALYICTLHPTMKGVVVVR